METQDPKEQEKQDADNKIKHEEGQDEKHEEKEDFKKTRAQEENDYHENTDPRNIKKTKVSREHQTLEKTETEDDRGGRTHTTEDKADSTTDTPGPQRHTPPRIRPNPLHTPRAHSATATLILPRYPPQRQETNEDKETHPSKK